MKTNLRNYVVKPVIRMNELTSWCIVYLYLMPHII